jgi:glycosyltransferase involved in cell wall biosynthesis
MRTLIVLYLNKYLDSQKTNEEKYVANRLNLDESNYMSNSIRGDLYVRLAEQWRKEGFIDSAKLIAIRYPRGHTRYSPQGEYDIGDKVKVFVLPNEREFEAVHRPSSNDILFVRGGLQWQSIVSLYRENNFKIFYDGSSTGITPPKKYSVNVSLYDDPEDGRRHGGRSLEFIKFCDENIFRPLSLEKRYDVCLIGTLTPKKGQLEFARIAEKTWRIAIVGDPTDKAYVRRIQEMLPQAEFFGEVSKARVNVILNQSKVAVIFSRKNDACPRVIVESLAAGTPVMIHRRNIGRKYVKPDGGIICGQLLFRRKLNRMIRDYRVYKPYEVYKQHFHSNRVARELWSKLGIPTE